MADQSSVRTYLEEQRRILAAVNNDDIWKMISALHVAHRRGKSVYVFGNGGSASTASHFATDLGKGVRVGTQRRFRVLSLTDNVSLITAWANDASYAHVFSEQLANFVQPGDVVVGISGSGNSPNVLAGMETARAHGAITVGLTGFEGGKLRALCDICIVAPSEDMGQIENAHVTIQHLACMALQALLSDDAAADHPQVVLAGAEVAGARAS